MRILYTYKNKAVYIKTINELKYEVIVCTRY